MGEFLYYLLKNYLRILYQENLYELVTFNTEKDELLRIVNEAQLVK